MYANRQAAPAFSSKYRPASAVNSCSQLPYTLHLLSPLALPVVHQHSASVFAAPAADFESQLLVLPQISSGL
jgi:hypothetical protein